jgi:hypothetical protein
MRKQQNRRTPQQERAAIDAGRKGDKTPGFDPAVAPMETDAEAAGTHTRSTEDAGADSSPRFRNAAAFDNAMRPKAGLPNPQQHGALWVIGAMVLVIAIIIGAAALWR